MKIGLLTNCLRHFQVFRSRRYRKRDKGNKTLPHFNKHLLEIKGKMRRTLGKRIYFEFPKDQDTIQGGLRQQPWSEEAGAAWLGVGVTGE